MELHTAKQHHCWIHFPVFHRESSLWCADVGGIVCNSRDGAIELSAFDVIPKVVLSGIIVSQFADIYFIIPQKKVS